MHNKKKKSWMKLYERTWSIFIFILLIKGAFTRHPFFFAVGAICTFLFILLARKVLFFLAAFFYFSSFHEFKIKNKLTTLKNDEILTSVLCFSTNESFFFYSRTYSRLVCYGCCMFVYFVLGTTDKYL